MNVETLKWVGDTDGFLELIDQRRLPGEFVKLQCADIEQLYEAIKTLAVRGAPAIGVTAAYGLVLGMKKLTADDDLKAALACLKQSCKYLATSRPTAVNLFRSLETVEHDAGRLTGAAAVCPGAGRDHLSGGCGYVSANWGKRRKVYY
jgi:methylthioribose-1-phosphate isomerase